MSWFKIQSIKRVNIKKNTVIQELLKKFKLF